MRRFRDCGFYGFTSERNLNTKNNSNDNWVSEIELPDDSGNWVSKIELPDDSGNDSLPEKIDLPDDFGF